MSKRVNQHGYKIADCLHSLVNNDVLPGLNINQQDFWYAVADVLNEFNCSLQYMKEVDLHKGLEGFKNPASVDDCQTETTETSESEKSSKLCDVYYKQSKMVAWRDSCIKQAQLAENGFKKFGEACS